MPGVTCGKQGMSISDQLIRFIKVGDSEEVRKLLDRVDTGILSPLDIQDLFSASERIARELVDMVPLSEKQNQVLEILPRRLPYVFSGTFQDIIRKAMTST